VPNHGLTAHGVAVREEIVHVYETLPYPPSLQELAEHLGLRSKSAVRQHVNRLVNDGRLERQPGHRGIVTLPQKKDSR
jgi:predicted ArsR family transcriptional regulator